MKPRIGLTLALLNFLAWQAHALPKAPRKIHLHFEDVVDELKTTPSETEVIFKRHAAIYRVGAHAQGRQALLETLKESRHEQTVVEITADPIHMDILSASPKVGHEP